MGLINGQCLLTTLAFKSYDETNAEVQTLYLQRKFVLKGFAQVAASRRKASREKLNFAMHFLFESYPTYHAAFETLTHGKEVRTFTFKKLFFLRSSLPIFAGAVRRAN